MITYEFLKQQTSATITQLTPAQWDALLSDDGLCLLRQWIGSAKEVGLSERDKLKEFSAVYGYLVAMPMIRHHERVEALLAMLRDTSEFYVQGRLLSVFRVLITKNAERGFARFLEELADDNKLGESDAKSLFNNRIGVINRLLEMLTENASPDAQQLWLNLFLTPKKPWSMYYWHFIDQIMTTVAQRALSEPALYSLSVFDGWRDAGFKMDQIALHGYTAKRQARVLNSPYFESRLLYSLLPCADIETLDWVWSWYSDEGKSRFIQRVSSNKSNKHELVDALHKSGSGMVWLSHHFGGGLPHYLLKQISHSVFTSYKRLVSRAKKCYEEHAFHLYAPITEPAKISAFKQRARNMFFQADSRAAFERFLGGFTDVITFEDMLRFIKSLFQPRALMLLDMYGKRSKSMLGLAVVTRNHDMLSDILNGLTLSNEEKRQWLSRALMECDQRMIDIFLERGAQVQSIILPMHLLYLCKEDFSEPLLVEFWKRVLKEPKTNIQKAVSAVNQSVPLHNILHTMPSEISREALAVTANRM